MKKIAAVVMSTALSAVSCLIGFGTPLPDSIALEAVSDGYEDDYTIESL